MASDFSPTASMLYFLIAEEGTKEGDDFGGPSVSEAGENDGVVACGLAAWAARGRARPACGCVWASRGGREPDRGCWAAIAVGELDKEDRDAS